MQKINWKAKNVNNFLYGIFGYPFSNAGTIENGMEVIFGDKVETIPNNAFSGCTGLTSVTIPNSVTSIGHSAFSGCIGLTSVTIPNSITSIGNSAFGGCTGLVNITIPESVTSIGDRIFYNCTGLTSVVIPDSVASIGDYSFYGCTSVISVTIPDSVRSIGIDAFKGCTGFSFRVIGKDYDQTFTTDKNGEIVIDGLRIGEYTVSEVSDKASSKGEARWKIKKNG